jgi:transcriptional regulator with XRE-family HTH domain
MQNSRDLLGSRLREARVAAGLSLRALARTAGVTPSYLSDIELGRRAPSEKTLASLAEALELAVPELLMGAGRLDEATQAYLARHPAAGRLLRRLAELGLGEPELEALLAEVDRVRSGQPETRGDRGGAPEARGLSGSGWSVEL